MKSTLTLGLTLIIKNMDKITKTILCVIVSLLLLTVGVQIGLKKTRDQINYKNASFIYNEEILCYKELVQAIDDYQFEKYNDTILIGENVRSQIDYLEHQLDSIYSVN